jgi:hypothetical protein
VAIALVAVQGTAFAQALTSASKPSAKNDAHGHARAFDLLRQLNISLVSLTKEVTPAVVQIMVTSYGPVEHGPQGAMSLCSHGSATLVLA